MIKKKKVIEIELPEFKVPDVMGWINQYKFLAVLIGVLIFILIVGGVFVNAVLTADYRDGDVVGGDNVMSDVEYQQIINQRQSEFEVSGHVSASKIEPVTVDYTALNFTTSSVQDLSINLIGLMGLSLYDHAGDLVSLGIVGMITSIAAILLGQVCGVFGSLRRRDR